LLKPKLTLLVLFTAVMTYLVALNGYPKVSSLLSFALSTFFVIGGANGFNQILERQYDAMMSRTAKRPLPKGTLTVSEAIIFVCLLSLAGFLLMFYYVNVLTGILAGLAFFNYLIFYTPMKRKSWWCTAVGAISGAIPVVMGWTAVKNSLDYFAILIFLVLFFWQFIHFFAIGYIYKEDYKKAGFCILPALDNKGKKTSFYTITSSILLLIIPLMLKNSLFIGNMCFVVSGLLSIGLMFYVINFAISFSKLSAYKLMMCAYLYLPTLFILMVLDKGQSLI
jgi:protoheme IX farnesyltransferase